MTSSLLHRAWPSQSSHTERNPRGSVWTQGCQERKRTRLTTFPVSIWQTFIQTINSHWEFTVYILPRSCRNLEVNQTVLEFMALKTEAQFHFWTWIPILRFPGLCPATQVHFGSPLTRTVTATIKFLSFHSHCSNSDLDYLKGQTGQKNYDQQDGILRILRNSKWCLCLNSF